jgi:hypothetical protein
MSVRSVSRGQGLVSVVLVAAFVGACTGSPPAKPGSGSAGSGGGNTGTAGSTGTAGKGGAGTAGTTGSTGTAGHGSAGNGAGATAGSGATGTAGAQGNGGSGAGGSSACASPQTSFGAIGQGNSNPNFLSGVGALGTNVMYIFSSYMSLTSAGAVSQEIYVQSFDPKSGASKGPSQSFFMVQAFENPTTSADPTQFFVTSAAVSPTGEIVLLYYLDAVSSGTYKKSLYAAFLSPSAAGGSSDGGTVDGLTLQKVVLVTDSNAYVGGPGGPADHSPQVIWSNTSQTFIVSYNSSGGGFNYFSKYSSGGQGAGGADPAPTNVPGNNSGQTEGSVGESGELLAYAYGCGGGLASACLTILDESENLVGQPFIMANNLGAISWASVAGTAKGFVYAYDCQAGSTQFPKGFIGEAFVSTSPDGGVGVGVAGDAGVTTFPGFTFTNRSIDGRLVADDIGTGGNAGVGMALVYDDSTVRFAYVSADGTGHQGPYTVIPHGGGAGTMSITNYNGNFAISSYTHETNSAQVIETGICP